MKVKINFKGGSKVWTWSRHGAIKIELDNMAHMCLFFYTTTMLSCTFLPHLFDFQKSLKEKKTLNGHLTWSSTALIASSLSWKLHLLSFLKDWETDKSLRGVNLGNKLSGASFESSTILLSQLLAGVLSCSRRTHFTECTTSFSHQF